MSLRGPDDVFTDYCGRRRGILKALTTEVDQFYAQCSPDKENLCLYGYPDSTWEVTLPCDEVPPELPEPALGINFARDGMKRSDWLSLVAVHSDSWLMAIACFNGARLDRDGRRQLFNSINALQTCYEIVSGKASYSGAEGNMNESNFPTAKRGRGANDNEGNGTTASQKRQKVPQNQESEADSDEGEQEDEDEEDDDAREWVDNSGDPCPNCGRLYRTGEFWIQCDDCDRWFDGKCVNMTQQKAERTRDWKCPFCARGH